MNHPGGQRDYPKDYYYSLDLLRFLAAVLVTGFHLGFSSWVNTKSNGARIVAGDYTIPETVDYVWFGWVGVQIFFVISGFVIANSASGASPTGFLRGRIERLYPAAWICATLSALVWGASGVVGMQEIAHRYIGSLTLWLWGPWIDGQYWTLSCEIVFYAAMYALLAFRKFHRIEWLAIALTAMGSLFILVFAANQLGWLDVPHLESFTKGRLRPFLFYYAQFFGLGILLWLHTQNRLSIAGWCGTAVAVVAGCAQIGLGAFGAVNMEERSDFGLQDRWFLPVLLWLGSCAVIALSKPLATRTLRWHPRILRIIRMAGLATYPQYLVHFALGVWLIHCFVMLGLAPLQALFLGSAIVIALSFLIAIYAESYVRKLLRRAFDRMGARGGIKQPAALN